MKKLLAASAAATMALTFAAPAIADNHDDMDDMAEAVALTAAQQAMYDGWPAERRTLYDGWPGEVQTYYWTLPADRQTAYWALNDEQRLQVYNLPAAQRATTWTSIMNQVNGTATAATAATRPATTTRTMGNAGMVQQVPAAQSGEYPPCSATRTDSCVNPREAGLNYGNRPLNYWPGKPASEMD